MVYFITCLFIHEIPKCPSHPMSTVGNVMTKKKFDSATSIGTQETIREAKQMGLNSGTKGGTHS